MLKFENLTKCDLLNLMNIQEEHELQDLYDTAYAIKKKYVNNVVYYRGLIEFSNVCIKDCYYCGLRKSSKQERYTITKKEIMQMALWAYENKFGSVTLQSGERQDKEFTDFISEIISEIKKATNGELAMTLCIGEQTEDVYKKWFDTGAHRYLLRIETSNQDLYQKIHPNNSIHSFQNRVDCLSVLKKIGYQVGTGVMIGLPEQTSEDLVNDIIFYKQHDIDMIGMGPYIIHKDTPLGQETINNNLDTAEVRNQRLIKSLKMIALTRIYLQNVNIAATTALQALHPMGRELGLKAGANILMPIITLPAYRKQYQLYDNKPCIDDSPEQCKNCLTTRVESIGDTVGFSKWGNSPHYKPSTKK